MTTHFNIAKKVEVNPFENVKFVNLSSSFSYGAEALRPFMDNVSEDVVARKINGSWVILYHIGVLDFTTLVQWLEPFRGKFYYKNKSVHFRIEEDVMFCW